MPRSGYVVRFAIGPGGMEREDVVVVGDATEVLRVLEIDLENESATVRSLNAELLLSGEDVSLWVVEAGEPKSRVLLRPFMRVTLPGGRVAPLDEVAPGTNPDEVAITIDRGRLAEALPPLPGDALRPGEVLDFLIDGLQAKQLDAEFLYFINRPVKWGYTNLGGAATPHLRKAFPRSSPKPGSQKKRRVSKSR